MKIRISYIIAVVVLFTCSVLILFANDESGYFFSYDGSDVSSETNTPSEPDIVKYDSQFNCEQLFSVNPDVSADIRRSLMALLENILSETSGYRYFEIALTSLGLNSSAIILPIYEARAADAFEISRSYGSMEFVYANDEFIKVVEQDISSGKFDRVLDHLRGFNPSGLSYKVEFDRREYLVSEFSIVMIAHLRMLREADFIESSLFASGLGLSPTVFDVLFVQMATKDIDTIDHLYRELPANVKPQLADLFYRHPTFGMQNALTISILANQFEIAEYWLSQNIISIGLGTHSIFYDISRASNEPDALEQLSFVLEKGLMPLTKDNVRALENAFSHERLLEFKQYLSFDFKELSENDQETVKSLRILVLSEADKITRQHRLKIPRKCRVQVAQFYLQRIDWNDRRERYAFLSKLDEQEIQSLMPSTATITSIAPSLPEDPTKADKVKKAHWMHIDSNLTKEQMNKLFKAAQEHDRETLNSLLRKAFGEELTQEQLLFVLTLAIFGNDKNLYLDTIPKVTQFPDEVIQPIVVFSDAIPVFQALSEDGQDIHRVFQQPKSNLLLEAMKLDRFESFEYLAKQGVALRTSAYVEDAFDLAVERLARNQDWRYIDVVLQSQLDLRESNFEVISQLKQIAPGLYDQFVEKYGVLQ